MLPQKQGIEVGVIDLGLQRLDAGCFQPIMNEPGPGSHDRSHYAGDPLAGDSMHRA